MRNIILAVVLTILATSLAFSQIDIKDTTGFNVYVSDTLYSTHKNISNALESQFKALKNNPNANPIIYPYGKVEATLSSTFFEGGDIGVEAKQIDTTFYTTQANKIFDSVTNARYFSIVYRPDSTKRHVNVLSIVAKDSLPKPLACTECGTKQIKIRFKAKEIDGNIFDAVELEHEYIEAVVDTFRIVEAVIRSSDSLKMRVQTYTNADWIFAYEESDDGVIWSERTIFETSTAGQPTNYLAEDGVVYAILYRHTREFTKKFNRVIAIRRSDRKEVSKVYINTDM